MSGFDWSPGGCCCVLADIYDFYGPPQADGNDITAVKNGGIVTRCASIFLNGTDDKAASHDLWSLDVSDIRSGSNGNRTWATRAVYNHDDRSARVWYFVTDRVEDLSTPVAYRTVAVDVPFNGSPTLVGEYDWATTWRNAPTGNLFTQPRRATCFTPSDTVLLGRPQTLHIGNPGLPDGVLRSVSELDLTDGTSRRLHEQTSTPSVVNAYYAADYRPYLFAREDASRAVGVRMQLTTTPGFPSTLDSIDLEVVLGTATLATEDSTVTNDLVLYNTTAATLISGATYEFDYAHCVCLERVSGLDLGIFVKGKARTTIDNNGYSNTINGQSYSQVDLLLPSGLVAGYSVRTTDWSDPIPLIVRHAVDAAGGANGNYFMLAATSWSVSLNVPTGPMFLRYMNGTTVIWSVELSAMPAVGVGLYDIAVTDRFVYVIGTLDGETDEMTLAVDYEGNVYETFTDSGTSGPKHTGSLDTNPGNTTGVTGSALTIAPDVADPLDGFGETVYYHNFDPVRYSDDLSPDTTLMARHA
jgi:hypothetical protein